jgi:hypothetical protein
LRIPRIAGLSGKKLAASLFFRYFQANNIAASISAATLNYDRINEAHVRLSFLACLALCTVAMTGVSFVAHSIVNHFAIMGGLTTIAAMYGAALWYD